METDRDEVVDRPRRRARRRAKLRRLFCLKYHIIAIPDQLVILWAMVIDYSVQDSPVPRKMLANLPAMPGCTFIADRGHDAEANFERIHRLRMRPNIKQRSKLDQWRGSTPDM